MESLTLEESICVCSAAFDFNSREKFIQKIQRVSSAIEISMYGVCAINISKIRCVDYVCYNI